MTATRNVSCAWYQISKKRAGGDSMQSTVIDIDGRRYRVAHHGSEVRWVHVQIHRPYGWHWRTIMGAGFATRSTAEIAVKIIQDMFSSSPSG
jgi:hypothetical protein